MEVRVPGEQFGRGQLSVKEVLGKFNCAITNGVGMSKDGSSDEPLWVNWDRSPQNRTNKYKRLEGGVSRNCGEHDQVQLRANTTKEYPEKVDQINAI